MKRYGYIFEKIYSIENLKEAHRNARKDKLFYKEVKMVDSNPDYYLHEIQKMLKNKTYEVSEYVVSIINDKGKERELRKLPYFPDRIIQWAIVLQLEPIFMSVFCSHSCASIKFRGIVCASRKVEKFMTDRENTKYCLKIDVSKFYPNIDHEVLKKMLRKKFKDPDLLELLDKIINSYPGGKGVPIGSYLSQFLANFYLTYFDHWLKETMKVKYVVRYMDDVVIFHRSKHYLHRLFVQMNQYLKSNLHLKIKSNWQVFPTGIRGIDFVGYRHFYGYKLLRKTTCKKFKAKMLTIRRKQDNGQFINYNEWCSVNSYIGWLTWCDSWRLFEKYIQPIIPSICAYYVTVINKGSHSQYRRFGQYQRKLINKKGRCAK